MVVGAKTYACTLKGVAMQAVDNWEYADAAKGSYCLEHPDRSLMAGRCQAYEAILLTITGVRAACTEDVAARWRESIEAMA